MKTNLETIVKATVGLLIALSFASCADINSGIKGFNEAIYQTTNTFSGVYEQNISRVIAPLPSKKAVQNVSQAYDVMQKSLSIIACAKKNNESYYLTVYIGVFGHLDRSTSGQSFSRRYCVGIVA